MHYALFCLVICFLMNVIFVSPVSSTLKNVRRLHLVEFIWIKSFFWSLILLLSSLIIIKLSYSFWPRWWLCVWFRYFQFLYQVWKFDCQLHLHWVYTCYQLFIWFYNIYVRYTRWKMVLRADWFVGWFNVLAQKRDSEGNKVWYVLWFYG